MPTTFSEVQNNTIIHTLDVNRYIGPINNLEKWREGTLPNVGAHDLGGNKVKNLSLGTAVAPSLSLQGDSDTGLYAPGADTLAVVTGGVERARFDSSGLIASGFQMSNGAAAGRVLTSDANGVGTWQAAGAGGGVVKRFTHLWDKKFTGSVTYTNTTYADLLDNNNNGVSGSLTVDSGTSTLYFLLGYGVEATAGNGTKRGRMRLYLSSSKQVPDATGVYFVTPYGLLEVSHFFHVFQVTGVSAGTYTVKLQIELDSSQQAQITPYCRLTCQCLEV